MEGGDYARPFFFLKQFFSLYVLFSLVGGNTEKWDPPDGPCFHAEREELSLSFQTLQKSLKNIKMVQNGDRKTPARSARACFPRKCDK